MIYTEVKFNFEMAHKLSNAFYFRETNIHGHSFKVKVSVSKKLNIYGDNQPIVEEGAIKEMIAYRFDKWNRALILHDEDKICTSSFLDALKEAGQKVLIANFNPSPELLAAYIYESIKQPLSLIDAELLMVNLKAEYEHEVNITDLNSHELMSLNKRDELRVATLEHYLKDEEANDGF